MEGGNRTLTGQPRQDRRVIAVADEQLGCGADHVPIQERHHVDAAVPSPRRNQRADIRIAPVAQESTGARFSGACQIPGLTRKYGLVVDGNKPEPAQLRNTSVELLSSE